MVFRAFFAVALALWWVAPASAASDAECRVLSIDQEDGSSRPTMMCRGADGTWEPASARKASVRARVVQGGDLAEAATAGEVSLPGARGQAGYEGGSSPRQAAEDPVANLPDAGPVLTRKLDGYVATDARGWAFNHYDAGSMRNVRVAEGSARSGTMVLRGDYTFNGGNAGWVLAKLVDGKLDCIQFWDAMVGCRALRTPEQGMAMRSAALGAVTGGGGGGGGSASGCDSNCQNARQSVQQQNEAYRQQQAEPVPAPSVQPIGGDRGFYGSDHSW